MYVLSYVHLQSSGNTISNAFYELSFDATGRLTNIANLVSGVSSEVMIMLWMHACCVYRCDVAAVMHGWCDSRYMLLMHGSAMLRMRAHVFALMKVYQTLAWFNASTGNTAATDNPTTVCFVH